MDDYRDTAGMSDADIEGVRAAIADAGMAAIGWTMGRIERDGGRALMADPVPYFARGLAHFRIGVLDRAARFNWSHRQRFYLAMYATAPPTVSGDMVLIENLTEAIFHGLVLEDGPPITVVFLSSKDIIDTADKLQSAVAIEIANERQANAPGGKDTRAHERYENMPRFRVTTGEN